MADHLNVPGTAESYCFSERDFVHCEGRCSECPSFTGRTVGHPERGGFIVEGATHSIQAMFEEIKYHKKCAWEKAGLDIERVIFNDPATIVFWTDGTKTVVKTHNEPFDQEKGIAMALVKKMGLSKKFRITVQNPKVEKPKKKKTYRDLMYELHPDRCGPGFVGGCEGCPSDVCPGSPSCWADNCLRRAAYPVDPEDAEKICAECWDQEVPES